MFSRVAGFLFFISNTGGICELTLQCLHALERACLPACLYAWVCVFFISSRSTLPVKNEKVAMWSKKKNQMRFQAKDQRLRAARVSTCVHAFAQIQTHTHTHTHVSTCWFGNLHFCMCAFTYWKAPQIISCVLHVAFMDPRSLLPLLPPSHPLTLKLCLSCLHVLAFTPSL